MNQQQWQSHIRACEKISQSKRGYTREHNLTYSPFLYWYRKLSERLIAVTLFLWTLCPVDIKPSVAPAENLGVLEFPNGMKLVINSPVFHVPLTKAQSQIPG